MLRSFAIGALALATTLSLPSRDALAESRIALVIGNSAYKTVPLPNPANDAKAITTFLNSAGFEVVSAPDLTQEGMRQAISDFATRVEAKGPDTVAAVFYAGHGLQVDGENFLVPVDAKIEREADVPIQAVRLADLMNALAAVPSRLRMVILDACRNNPFSSINKVTGRGLAIVDAPEKSIVAYATAPGGEAEDGDGANSPFTTAFLGAAKEPGMPIELVLRKIRVAVTKQTEGRQTPWDSSSLTSEFSFFAPNAEQGNVVQANAAPGITAAPASSSPGQANVPAKTAAVAAATRAEDLRGDELRRKGADYWRKEIRSRPQQAAYDLVVGADELIAYREYLLFYPTGPQVLRLRTLVERRELMVAWYEAVALNSVVGYEAFLAKYESSDFAETARRLLMRARLKPQPAPLAAASLPLASAASAATCPCGNPTPNQSPLRGRRASLPEANSQTPSAIETPRGTPPVIVTTPPRRDPPVVVIPPRGKPPVIEVPVRGKPPIIRDGGRKPHIDIHGGRGHGKGGIDLRGRGEPRNYPRVSLEKRGSGGGNHSPAIRRERSGLGGGFGGMRMFRRY